LTLREYLQVIRERWVLVVSGLVLGVVVAGVVTLLTPSEYSSSAVLYVASQSQSNTDTTQAAYQGSLLSQERVKSYAQMITSDRITRAAAQQMGDPSLADRVTASTQPDTVLLTASVTDRRPERAAAMANAVADVFGRAVAALEQPADQTKPPTVSIKMFEPAQVPTAPTSPKISLDLALGAVLGLLVGLGAAVARHILDTRISSVEEVERLVEAPSLGAIAFDKATAEKPLIVESDPQARRAEAFRQIRTNLQFVGVESRRKVIVVTSSVPDEGKSFTACNLALALKAAGISVALVEGDLRRPRVADYFGLDRTVGLTSVLTGRVRLETALQPWGGNTLQILGSGVLPPDPSELLGSRNMQETLDELGRRFAVVLVDAPPVLPVTDAVAVGRLCDGALVIVRHGKTTRPQVQATVAALQAGAVRVLGTIVNRVPTRGPQSSCYHGAYYPRNDDGVTQTDDAVTVSPAAAALHTAPLQTRVGEGQHIGPHGRTTGHRHRPSPEPRVRARHV